MPKFTLEFEASNATEFLRQIAEFLDLPLVPNVSTTLAGPSFPDDEPPEAEAEAPVPNGDGSKRGRGRPKKASVMPVTPPAETPEPMTPVTASAKAMLEASTQSMKDLPTLDVLKAAITTAVRLAQKGEGDPAILGLLPEFKTETGLPFVMNAQEEHRPALFHLLKRAGLTLG